MIIYYDKWIFYIFVCVSHWVLSNSMRPHGLKPTRLFLAWDSPGNNTRVVVISFTRISAWPQDWTQVSCIAGRCFTIWATQFSSVQLLSRVWLFVTSCIAACQASLSIRNSQSLLKLISIQSVMPFSHLICCRPLLLCPQSLPASGSFPVRQLLAWGGQSNWSFSFSFSPSSEHPGLISFGMDWLDLLAVQGTLKSFLQHHSSKVSIFQCSAFFTVQLSHPYMTTGKIIALTRWTFVGKVMSLLLNMLSRLVITFLPRNKRLLISWLQSPSAVILEPKRIKSDAVSTVSPSICHEVMGLDAMIWVLWMLSLKPTFHSFSLS